MVSYCSVISVTYVRLGIIMHFVLAFICLHFMLSDTGVLNSLEELCIMLVAAVNSFIRVLNPQGGGVYIVIRRQTVSLYHNSSVWLNMQDALSWDWNPPNFTLDLVSYFSAISTTYISSGIITHFVLAFVYIYIYIYRERERHHQINLLHTLSGNLHVSLWLVWNVICDTGIRTGESCLTIICWNWWEIPSYIYIKLIRKIGIFFVQIIFWLFSTSFNLRSLSAEKFL